MESRKKSDYQMDFSEIISTMLNGALVGGVFGFFIPTVVGLIIGGYSSMLFSNQIGFQNDSKMMTGITIFCCLLGLIFGFILNMMLLPVFMLSSMLGASIISIFAVVVTYSERKRIYLENKAK